MSMEQYLAVNLVMENGKVVGASIKLKASPVSHKIRILGSTMPCSVRTKERVTSFGVLKPIVLEGMVDVDILAVLIEISVAGQIQWISDFIVVDWREKIDPFNLSRGLWMPWMRLGQIVGDRIDVTVGNELFTTCVVEAQKDLWEKTYEVDGDTICGYIADQCGVEQLYHNATDTKLRTSILELAIKFSTENNNLLAENSKLLVENEELTARLERVMTNFWEERAECAAWQSSAKIWYTRYQTLRKDVLGRGFWAWALGRLTRNIDTGEFDPKGDKYPEDKDVLSCLPREKEDDDEFVAP